MSALSVQSAKSSETELPEKVHFSQHVRPILAEHCVACHGGVKQAGDVSFVYRNKVLPPEGWVVEPGDPESSTLIERVESDDPELVMPPPDHSKSLSQREIAILRKWISGGAVWEEHWAFEKPISPPIPTVENVAWPRNAVDRFVLARLEEHGVAPAVDEAPHRWLRRAHLDLTGLPPTLDEQQLFYEELSLLGESAYENAVDRLLDSPHFGERWASVWLDQVRYADSKGLGIDGRRNIWKYRDWVISAFNRDMPFDEFTVKQIAGDLLANPTMDDLIATAVHRLTQSNEEGGTDDEEFRIGAVMDRVSTTWQAWQGVTFGCVQCHNHPYAPFDHEEYYQFAAFFNNTADCDLNEEWPTVQVPIEEQEYDQARALDRSIEQLRTSIWEKESELLNAPDAWRSLMGSSVSSNNATKIAIDDSGEVEEFHTVGTVSRNTDITIQSSLPDGIKQLRAIRLTAKPLDPQAAVSDSEWGFCVSHIEAKLIAGDGEAPKDLKFSRVVADEAAPFLDPNDSLNPKSNRGFAAYTRIHYPRMAAFILEEPLEIPEGAQLQVTLKHRIYLLAAFSLITRRGSLSVSDDPRFAELDSDESLAALRNRLSEAQSARKGIPSTSLPVLRERPQPFVRPTHVFVRGLFLTKDKQVSPGVPEALPDLPVVGPETDRRALAQWLVSSENPLTARVAVNRVWARLFGIGIVATEEDFGSSGEAPSHPGLLDFLAVRFQQVHQWRFKKLLRELVLSRTYRQSSKIRSALLEEDPNNRLLARGPRHRLAAETVRDQALMVSGLLSSKLYGPPVHPPIPEGVWRPFASGDKWNTPGQDDENRYRRSIYTYMKRSIPFPMFSAFDAPSREFCTPRRLRSNTPLQALMTLNDATATEAANALAARMLEFSSDPEAAIEHGFQLTLCREPTGLELNELVRLCTQESPEQVGAGLQSVATVLLNLDEFLTK